MGLSTLPNRVPNPVRIMKLRLIVYGQPVITIPAFKGAPPPTYRIAVLRMRELADDATFDDYALEAEFKRLRIVGDRADYVLVTKPAPGKMWIVQNDTLLEYDRA